MTTSPQPNVLFVMTDQQRLDTIAALGNTDIATPNLDRLVRRGVAFTEAHSTCPVCVPARYTIRTGCEPTRTGLYANAQPPGGHAAVRERCGPFLAETMAARGYRTFGVGKFHTQPWDAEVGFEVQLHSEELYDSPEQRAGDAFAAWIASEHPAYDWVEGLMGERTEMYYMPQMSPLPAACTVEAWAADRTVELIGAEDPRPWFGLVSFIGPHPPFAPPLPFNRMYDPDRMPDPVVGDLAVDHLDQQIPWMNHLTFAEDVDPVRARSLKARYYGEISYIDTCVGRILDCVDARPDASNTLICFYADHGDLLGDHHGWQKESFFNGSTKMPFLLSWPERIPAGAASTELVCLTDLFGIATGAAGEAELRQGHDVLGMITGDLPARDHLIGLHGQPGTERFKAMVRQGPWKLVWLANGGHHLLFDQDHDPDELSPVDDSATADRLTAILRDRLRAEGITEAFDGERLRVFPYREWPRGRIYQFDHSRGVTGFPATPADLASGSAALG